MLDFSTKPLALQVISVSELNRLAKDLLEQHLPLTWVAGEVSNFKRYDSGHCYFTLKDAQAQVDCVMFRHRFQYLDWLPESGMQVEVRAYPTLYEARGKFQLSVETMRRAGLGALYEAYEKLKAKLEKEGLFDAAHKKPLPEFPRAVGVVTSLQAAALRDVLTTLRRRMPRLPVVVYPAPVQGEGAGQKIAAAAASRTCGRTTKKPWRARYTPARFPSSPASVTRPISPSPTSSLTRVRQRPPPRRSWRHRTGPSCSSKSCTGITVWAV